MRMKTVRKLLFVQLRSNVPPVIRLDLLSSLSFHRLWTVLIADMVVGLQISRLRVIGIMLSSNDIDEYI